MLKCGTIFRKIPSNRSDQSTYERCVLCGKQTDTKRDTHIDLRTCYVEGAGQLCPEFWRQLYRNASEPERISYGSKFRAAWQCAEGHRWSAQVWSRTGGSGCPVCAGNTVVSGINDLKTKFPEIAKEWHPTMNGTLTPESVTCGSAKKVWWQCSEGHAWKAIIYSRTGKGKCGCPVCSGRVKQSRQLCYTAMLQPQYMKTLHSAGPPE